jgi:hypothetical protein
MGLLHAAPAGPAAAGGSPSTGVWYPVKPSAPGPAAGAVELTHSLTTASQQQQQQGRAQVGVAGAPSSSSSSGNQGQAAAEDGRSGAGVLTRGAEGPGDAAADAGADAVSVLKQDLLQVVQLFPAGRWVRGGGRQEGWVRWEGPEEVRHGKASGRDWGGGRTHWPWLVQQEYLCHAGGTCNCCVIHHRWRLSTLRLFFEQRKCLEPQHSMPAYLCCWAADLAVQGVLDTVPGYCRAGSSAAGPVSSRLSALCPSGGSRSSRCALPTTRGHSSSGPWRWCVL